jgi:hypothetical protein
LEDQNFIEWEFGRKRGNEREVCVEVRWARAHAVNEMKIMMVVVWKERIGCAEKIFGFFVESVSGAIRN